MLTKKDRAKVRGWMAGRAYFFAGVGPAAARGVCDLIEHHPLFADMPHPYAVVPCEHPVFGGGLLVSPSCWRGPTGGPRAEWQTSAQELMRRYGQLPGSLLFPSWPKAPDYEPARAGTERFHLWERVRPGIFRGILK